MKLEDHNDKVEIKIEDKNCFEDLYFIAEKVRGAGVVGISRGEHCQVSQPEDRRSGGGRGEGRAGQDVYQLW